MKSIHQSILCVKVGKLGVIQYVPCLMQNLGTCRFPIVSQAYSKCLEDYVNYLFLIFTFQHL